MIYSNAALIRQWGVPKEIAATRDEHLMLGCACQQLIDPAQFLNEVDRVTPTTEPVEDELLLRDGRILMRRSVPFVTDGEFAGRLWVFSDVTDARSARLDPLCGIPNRRAYSIDFPAFAEAAPDGSVRSIGIVDVDNFKAYNDCTAMPRAIWCCGRSARCFASGSGMSTIWRSGSAARNS